MLPFLHTALKAHVQTEKNARFAPPPLDENQFVTYSGSKIDIC